MLNYLKKESRITRTENGAATHASTASNCLDLFATIGAIRRETEQEIIGRFIKAYAENRDIAMKILFFGRDVRGGLGERRVFRVIVNWLADHEPEALRKNIALIPEYGRFDDLMALMGTACEKDAMDIIKNQLKRDMKADTEVSLLAKWLPSVNASSKETVRLGKRIARYLGMTDEQYRKILVQLRKKIQIIENNLREKDYSFDYGKQPSKAMFKYRKAFVRNDGVRYQQFLEQVQAGTAAIHTGTLMPYDVIAPCFDGWSARRKLSEAERWILHGIPWRISVQARMHLLLSMALALCMAVVSLCRWQWRCPWGFILRSVIRAHFTISSSHSLQDHSWWKSREGILPKK